MLSSRKQTKLPQNLRVRHRWQSLVDDQFHEILKLEKQKHVHISIIIYEKG